MRREKPSPVDAASGIGHFGFWRLYEIHRLLTQNAYPNCADLAQRFEVSTRTAERDIERLRDVFHAPLAYDRSKKGYYYAGPFDLPPVRLQEGEAIAVFLGQKLLGQCKGTPFEKFIRQAMEKIKWLLPHNIEVNLDKVVGSVSFHTEPLRGDELAVLGRYTILSQCIERQESVTTDYFTASRQTVTHRKLDPYHLRLAEGTWYCIAYCHERGDLRTFALDRMTRLRATGERFVLPADFSVEDYLADSLSIERGEPTRVVIEFHRGQAPYVRGRQWHKSQKLKEMPDGSLQMTLTVGGLGEVMRWVLSMGSRAWILEPPDLRERAMAEMLLAIQRYEETAPKPKSRQLPLFPDPEAF